MTVRDLLFDLRDATMAYTIRNERSRPEDEKREEMVRALKIEDEIQNRFDELLEALNRLLEWPSKDNTIAIKKAMDAIAKTTTPAARSAPCT